MKKKIGFIIVLLLLTSLVVFSRRNVNSLVAPSKLNVKSPQNQDFHLNSIAELEELLPPEAKCNGKIVKELPPLEDSTLDNPSGEINKLSPLIKQVSIINCIQPYKEENDELEKFLIEKVIFKDDMGVVIKARQQYETAGVDYFFILPHFYHDNNDVKFWYKKTSELLYKTSQAAESKWFFDHSMKELNKALSDGYVTTPEGKREKLNFGIEFQTQDNGGMYETIILDKPGRLKDNRGSFIKLSYSLLGPF